MCKKVSNSCLLSALLNRTGTNMEMEIKENFISLPQLYVQKASKQSVAMETHHSRDGLENIAGILGITYALEKHPTLVYTITL